jgi:hypothetical protein
MSSQSHRWASVVRSRRSAFGLLAGLAGAAAVAVPSTLAASKHASAPSAPTITKPAPTGHPSGATITKPAPTSSTAPAGTIKTPAPAGTGTAPDPVFASAIAQLAQAGAIDSAQAQAIDAQIRSQSLDLQQLVNSGIITAAQAGAAQNALAQAKMSLGPANRAAGSAKRGNVRHVSRHRRR